MYEALGIHHGPAIDTAAPFSDALHTVPSGMVSHGEGMGETTQFLVRGYLQLEMVVRSPESRIRGGESMDFFVDADCQCRRKIGGGSRFGTGHMGPFYTAGLVRVGESWESRGRRRQRFNAPLSLRFPDAAED
jgi:hypothetical protein